MLRAPLFSGDAGLERFRARARTSAAWAGFVRHGLAPKKKSEERRGRGPPLFPSLAPVVFRGGEHQKQKGGRIGTSALYERGARAPSSARQPRERRSVSGTTEGVGRRCRAGMREDRGDRRGSHRAERAAHVHGGSIRQKQLNTKREDQASRRERVSRTNPD